MLTLSCNLNRLCVLTRSPQILGEELETSDENIQNLLNKVVSDNILLRALKVSFYSLSRPGFPLILNDKFIKKRFYDFIDSTFPLPNEFMIEEDDNGRRKYKNKMTNESTNLRPFTGSIKNNKNIDGSLTLVPPSNILTIHKSLNSTILLATSLIKYSENGEAGFKNILEIVLLNLILLVDREGKHREGVKGYNVNVEFWWRVIGKDCEAISIDDVKFFVEMWKELRKEGEREGNKLNEIFKNYEQNTDDVAREVMRKWGRESGMTRDEFKKFAEDVELKPPVIVDFSCMPIFVKYLELSSSSRSEK